MHWAQAGWLYESFLMPTSLIRSIWHSAYQTQGTSKISSERQSEKISWELAMGAILLHTMPRMLKIFFLQRLRNITKLQSKPTDNCFNFRKRSGRHKYRTTSNWIDINFTNNILKWIPFREKKKKNNFSKTEQKQNKNDNRGAQEARLLMISWHVLTPHLLSELHEWNQKNFIKNSPQKSPQALKVCKQKI